MAYILLVEDNPVMLETLSLAIRSKGHHVVTATDGEEAKEALSERHFDLVVTDILMPAMDGLGLIDAVRAKAPDVKILAISGGGTATFFDFLDAARKHGATATLEKPFPMSEFYDTLGKCLQN